jgi:lysyl-tRNA synthetase class I
MLIANHDWRFSASFIYYDCSCERVHKVPQWCVTSDGTVHHQCECGSDQTIQLIGFMLIRPAPRAPGAAS